MREGITQLEHQHVFEGLAKVHAVVSAAHALRPTRGRAARAAAALLLLLLLLLLVAVVPLVVVVVLV